MNLDLLKKLTKLANHNPNDHEANSAARRVCKMLEECNFTLTPVAKDNPLTWNDIVRSETSSWRSSWQGFGAAYKPPYKSP